MPDALATAVDTLSFEEAMAELEGIVDRLEHGNVPLEQSIAFYERGEALKTRCDALLKNAEMRVEKVRLKAGQPAGTEPLDPEGDPAGAGPAVAARVEDPGPRPRPRPAQPARPAPAPVPAASPLDGDDDIPF